MTGPALFLLSCVQLPLRPIDALFSFLAMYELAEKRCPGKGGPSPSSPGSTIVAFAILQESKGIQLLDLSGCTVSAANVGPSRWKYLSVVVFYVWCVTWTRPRWEQHSERGSESGSL